MKNNNILFPISYVILTIIAIVVIQCCVRREMIPIENDTLTMRERVVIDFNVDTLEFYYQKRLEELEIELGGLDEDDNGQLNKNDFILNIPSWWKFWSDLYIEVTPAHSMYKKMNEKSVGKKIADDFPDDFEYEVIDEEKKIYRLKFINVNDGYVVLPIWFVHELVEREYLPKL